MPLLKAVSDAMSVWARTSSGEVATVVREEESSLDGSVVGGRWW